MSVTTTLYTKAGAEAGTVDLPEALFAAPVNTAVLHQAVVAQLAGRRTGTADTKTRGEVRGGGKKPYRQKGTGRARQGTPHRSALRGRRRGLRPASPVLRPEAAQADAPPGPPGRPDLQVHRRRHQVRGGPGPRGHQDPRARGLPRCAPGPGPGARGRGRQGRAAGAVGTQPARRPRHPRRLAQRGGHPERRHAGHHPAVLGTMAEVYA